MSSEVGFSIVMKDPNNWHEQANFDIMSANYNVLKPIMNKFCFSSYPAHPKLFSLLFSNPNFSSELIESLMQNHIKVVEKVVFTEYTLEEKHKLQKMGVVTKSPDDEAIVIVFTFCKNYCFVNLFPNNQST